ncbi:unnamed protein product, partial [marine sediment metagenome]
TVEKQHLETECGFEYVNTADNECNWSTVLKCGLLENWDIGIEFPYQFIDVTEGSDVDGIGDMVVSSKYRFLDETQGFPALSLSFAIKTDTGNEDKGLGSGDLDYTITAILTKELNKIVGHLNLGYIYVGAPEGQDDDVFSYALALEYPVDDRLNFVGELSGETNFEGDFDDNPFAALVGFNYAFSDAATFDFGAAWQISEASPDYKLVTGLTLGF